MTDIYDDDDDDDGDDDDLLLVLQEMFSKSFSTLVNTTHVYKCSRQVVTGCMKAKIVSKPLFIFRSMCCSQHFVSL